jgi:putative DNA primase/helicase
MNVTFTTAIGTEPLEPRIPAELLSCPQWIAWWSVVGGGGRIQLPNGRWTGVLKARAKPHKLPIDPRTGGLAASTRSATWSSAEQAQAAVKKWSLTGIGFVFSDSDTYGGVDVDNCRSPDTGQIAEWALETMRGLNSYTEISPSKTGVHPIVRGKLPDGMGNQTAYHDGKVEMFSRARYFTITGIHVHGTPIEIFDRQTELLALHKQVFPSRTTPNAEKHSTPLFSLLVSDDELIAKARQAQNGSKFERLWNGHWEGDYPSQSEADLALCCLLAFWTSRDRARIDELFRRSGLMRKKWLRDDYREDTLAKASR